LVDWLVSQLSGLSVSQMIDQLLTH